MDKGYGLWVEVCHPDGRLSRYAHLNKIFVAKGQWIGAGAVIGEAGKSGNANDPRIRPHLHYEIRQKGEAVDPLKFFEPKLIVR
jgi:murein DD-endopeptidase MepM/ murein hydrolase activator NlpD